MAPELVAFPTKRKRRYSSPTLSDLRRAKIPPPENCVSLATVRIARREAADAELVTVQVSRGFWNAVLEMGRRQQQKDDLS